MSTTRLKDGIAAGRLAAAEYRENFSDLHPPLTDHEAVVAAERCYFCFDAPCVKACPTAIDIPMFIRQIATGNPLGSARTIFDQNILGGMCARVCPTEELCERACVREAAEGKPVDIGRLQRYATDKAIAASAYFYERAAPTGRKVAIVGAGPAGLACAHRLAMHGHDVEIFEAKEKPGGLNEYGIAAYKTVGGFAQREVDYIAAIGGITIVNSKALGRDLSLDELARDHDAVFLALGLAGVNALGGQATPGVADAVDFIARLRQAGDYSGVPIGRRVVVIGGGMTAIDCAVQAKLLGAEEVTIFYRRGPDAMKASRFERDLAATKGVSIRHWLAPKRVVAKAGVVAAVEFEYTAEKGGGLVGTGETLTLPCDQLFTAIGQTFVTGVLNDAAKPLRMERGKIAVDAEGRTSLKGVWAGGDCASAGDDLTVSAVAQGRDAAESINRFLMGG